MTEKKHRKKNEGIPAPSKNETISKPKNRHFYRFIIKLCFFAAIFLVLASFGVFLGKKLINITEIKKQNLIFSQLRNCQELCVLKYGYSEIVSIKKTRIAGLAKAFSIIRYSGTVRAGINDLSLAEIKVNTIKNSAEIKLPPAEILGTEITEMEVFDESRSVFIPFSTQEIFDLINENRSQKELELVDKGLLEEAQMRSKLLAENLLYALGFESVEIK